MVRARNYNRICMKSLRTETGNRSLITIIRAKQNETGTRITVTDHFGFILPHEALNSEHER